MTTRLVAWDPQASFDLPENTEPNGHGNLIQSTDQRSDVLHYVYDKIGPIQKARNSQTGCSETFAFDPAHNILSDKAAEGKGRQPTSCNRLKEYNGIEYTYDN